MSDPFDFDFELTASGDSDSIDFLDEKKTDEEVDEWAELRNEPDPVPKEQEKEQVDEWAELRSEPEPEPVAQPQQPMVVPEPESEVIREEVISTPRVVEEPEMPEGEEQEEPSEANTDSEHIDQSSMLSSISSYFWHSQDPGELQEIENQESEPQQETEKPEDGENETTKEQVTEIVEQTQQEDQETPQDPQETEQESHGLLGGIVSYFWASGEGEETQEVSSDDDNGNPSSHLENEQTQPESSSLEDRQETRESPDPKWESCTDVNELPPVPMHEPGSGDVSVRTQTPPSVTPSPRIVIRRVKREPTREELLEQRIKKLEKQLSSLESTKGQLEHALVLSQWENQQNDQDIWVLHQEYAFAMKQLENNGLRQDGYAAQKTFTSLCESSERLCVKIKNESVKKQAMNALTRYLPRAEKSKREQDENLIRIQTNFNLNRDFYTDYTRTCNPIQVPSSASSSLTTSPLDRTMAKMFVKNLVLKESGDSMLLKLVKTLEIDGYITAFGSNDLKLLHRGILTPTGSFVQTKQRTSIPTEFTCVEFHQPQSSMGDWIKENRTFDTHFVWFQLVDAVQLLLPWAELTNDIVQSLEEEPDKFDANLEIMASLCLDRTVVVDGNPQLCLGLARDVPFLFDESSDFAHGSLKHLSMAPPEIEGGSSSSSSSSSSINWEASYVWGIGTMMFEAHFGRSPQFGRTGEIEIPAHSDNRLRSVLKRCLAIDASERPNLDQLKNDPFLSMSENTSNVQQSRELISRDSVVEMFRCFLKEKNRVFKSCSYDARVRIEANRNNLVDSVLTNFGTLTKNELEKQIYVVFRGEEGVGDGVKADMFASTMDALVSEECSLFLTGSKDGQFVLPKPWKEGEEERKRNSHLSDILRVYRGVGRFLARCLVENIPWHNTLAPSFFKFLAGQPLTISDLFAFNPDAAVPLLRYIDDVEGYDAYNEDPENVSKTEFVEMKLNEDLVDSRRSKLESIRQGFLEVEGFNDFVQHMHWEALRDMACGSKELTAELLLEEMVFSGFVGSDTPRLLKRYLQTCSGEQLKQFLHFVTSLSSIAESGLPKKIQIRCKTGVDLDHLPEAHTCFFQMDLPDYNQFQLLKGKMDIVLENANGFQIA